MNKYTQSSIFILMFYIVLAIYLNKHNILNSNYYLLKKYSLRQIMSFLNILAIIFGCLYFKTGNELFYLLFIALIILENIYELAFGLSKKKFNYSMLSHHSMLVIVLITLYDFFKLKNIGTFWIWLIFIHLKDNLKIKIFNVNIFGKKFDIIPLIFFSYYLIYFTILSLKKKVDPNICYLFFSCIISNFIIGNIIINTTQPKIKHQDQL